MTGLLELAAELHRRIEWQKTPEEVYQDDLAAFIVAGLKDLYIITGRAAVFSDSLIELEDGLPARFAHDLPLDEREYVLLSAQIAFFTKVKTDVNNMVGYTTDALSVTHADRPYKYLSDTVADLETKRKTMWFKMVRYNL